MNKLIDDVEDTTKGLSSLRLIVNEKVDIEDHDRLKKDLVDNYAQAEELSTLYQKVIPPI